MLKTNGDDAPIASLLLPSFIGPARRGSLINSLWPTARQEKKKKANHKRFIHKYINLQSEINKFISSCFLLYLPIILSTNFFPYFLSIVYFYNFFTYTKVYLMQTYKYIYIYIYNIFKTIPEFPSLIYA